MTEQTTIEHPVIARPTTDQPLALDVRDLHVAYRVRGHDQAVLHGVSFQIGAGETFGLVGESGCGKSTAALAVLRALPRAGRITSGSVHVDGRDLLAADAGELRRLRTRALSMVYQDPCRALNPTIPVGRQLAEVFSLAGMAGREADERSRDILGRVRIADPGGVMGRYPHQLSGGMQQRVVIAMALAVDRRLLVLDEPTTGLDATVEAEVLDLIEVLRSEYSTAVLFIGHNLEVIARMCARVGVLYAGQMVETGPTHAVFDAPRHPYTVGLLRCLPQPGMSKQTARLDTIPGFLPSPGEMPPGCVFAPRCGLVRELCREERPALIQISEDRASRCHDWAISPDLPRVIPAIPPPPVEHDAEKPVVRISALSKTFGHGANAVHALRGIDLDIRAGETLGLVGESGSGKSTLARIMLGITPPDAGSRIELDGLALPVRALLRTPAQARALQMVFQNPDSALNRAHSVRRIVGRPLRRLAGLNGAALTERLSGLMRSVRLADRFLPSKPRQLSGGLKQRVAIARAFAGSPRVVVCDEPTSALDVSVQAAILNLLAELQADQGVSYLFVSHDLAVVRYLSDRIAVLYLGRLLEIGPAERLFSGPRHPYTEALLSAVGASGERIRLTGEIPSAVAIPSGCVFHGRCPRYIGPICDETEPPLSEREPGHLIRCHHATAALAGGAQPSP